MDIDKASVFLGSSILMSLGVIIIVCAVVFMNNIIHRYWKSFGWKFFPMYIHKEEVVYQEPKMDKK